MLHVNKLENALDKEPTLLQQESLLTLNYVENIVNKSKHRNMASTSRPDWWTDVAQMLYVHFLSSLEDGRW